MFEQVLPVLENHEDLLGARAAADYTEAERSFGAEVGSRHDDLLQGRREQVLVMRRYHGESDRILDSGSLLLSLVDLVFRRRI